MKRRDFLKGLLAVSVAPLATCSFIPQKPGISEIPDYECGSVYECGVADNWYTESINKMMTDLDEANVPAAGRFVVHASSDGRSEGDVLIINDGSSIRDEKYTITSINKKNFAIEPIPL